MSTLNIQVRMAYDLSVPTDCLLQVEVARMPGQEVLDDSLRTTPVEGFRRVAGADGVGQRAWFRAEGRLELSYDATVRVTRPDPDLRDLAAAQPHTLPADATGLLMPSRYVPSDLFEAVAADRFDGGSVDGPGVVATMRDWVEDRFAYVPGASDATTTALESYMARRGVCRDYAHVLIALARASGVPARMASVYATDVDPPDFHAVAEVWLGDAWHLVDPTGMARPTAMAVIGVGRDAADVSFLTMMGAGTLVSQSVEVVAAAPDDADDAAVS